MMLFSLGIDTSNYTTSTAVVSVSSHTHTSYKRLLPVKHGEIGLRQSDAVFHHTKQLPELIEQLYNNRFDLTSVGVSVKPRNSEGSYMPCFLVGRSNAVSISKALNIPINEFSHQSGHIAATLYGANRLDLLSNNFIALHLSGGTTEAVLVTPDKETVIKEKVIAFSSDLKAGQAIDRVGNMLGLAFPSGVEIDKLSLNGTMPRNIKISSSGTNISLSGIENICKKLVSDGVAKEDIALYCINHIIYSIDKMISELYKEYRLPIVFGGGVSSNTLLQKFFIDKYGAVFSTPEFSSDNAIGVAVLSQILRS